MTAQQKCFTHLVSLVDTIHELLLDAVKVRGIVWTQEPLWLTWSLDRFGAYLSFSLGDVIYNYIDDSFSNSKYNLPLSPRTCFAH
jgi:hypothetical protein